MSTNPPIFSIQSGSDFDHRAKMAIYEYCQFFNISYEESPKRTGLIPVGTLEYCGGYDFHSDPYSSLVKGYISRKIQSLRFISHDREKFDRTIDTFGIQFPVFVKDGSKWKNNLLSKVFQDRESLWNAINNSDESYLWLYFSEVVDFLEEWRYYVYRGVPLTS